MSASYLCGRPIQASGNDLIGERVSGLVRTFSHAQIEVWSAAEWRFKERVRSLPAKGGKPEARRPKQQEA